MTSVRMRTCAAGAVVAVLAGLLVDHGALFGSDFLKTALLGVLAGAVLGCVPHRAALERLGAFLAGFGAAWLGYLLRADRLPDIPMGRAIVAVLVVSAVTAVAVASADRLPLWAGLLGAGTLVGAYEAGYTTAPSDALAESTTAATSVLLAAAFGFVLTAVITAAARPATAHDADDADDADNADHADDDVDTARSGAAAETDSGRRAAIDLTERDTSVLPGLAPTPAPRVDLDAPTQSETKR